MSFNNVNDEQAIEAMTKAMMGETESMKSLGVNLSETIMEQSEFVKSTGKSWKEMTLAEKANARYQEAMKQSKNAIGDAEKTSKSFTSQMKAMKGNMQELAVAIGNTLVPILEPLIIKFNEMLDGLVKFAEENPRIVGTLLALAGALAVVPPILFAVGKGMEFWGGLSATTISAISGIALALGILAIAFLPIDEIMPKIQEKFKNFLDNLVQKVIENAPIFTQKAIELINSFFSGFTTNFPILLEGFIGLIGTLAQAIWTMLPSFISSASAIISALISGIVTYAPILVGKIADIILRLVSKIAENLPSFLQKGIELVVNLISGIGKKMPQLTSKAFELMGKVLDEIGKRLPQFMAKGVEIILHLISGLWSNRGAIFGAMGDLMAGLLKTVGVAIKGFISLGAKIVGYIKDGISGAWSGVTGWIARKISAIPLVGKVLSKSTAQTTEPKLRTMSAFSTFGAMTTQAVEPNMVTSLSSNPALFGATTKQSLAGLKIKTSKDKDSKKLLEKLDALLSKDNNISIEVPLTVDGKQIAKASARYIETEIDTISKRKTRLGGAF